MTPLEFVDLLARCIGWALLITVAAMFVTWVVVSVVVGRDPIGDATETTFTEDDPRWRR